MKFKVGNMSCGHCVRTITAAIQASDAGATVQVDLAAGTVRVQGRLDAAQAIAAMAAEDYPAEEIADEGDAAPVAASCCGTCRA